jgi:predicted RNase H-like nuclease
VAVELDGSAFVAARLIDSVTSSFSELHAAEVIAIDVPIGYGPRPADTAARAYLRGAASTVFSTPPRELLERPFAPGLGISKQSHSLGPRILHVTELALRDKRIYEVHPEVSFRAMNLGMPLRYRKKSAGGAVERMRLLACAGIDLDDLGDAAKCQLDDVLDSAA